MIRNSSEYLELHDTQVGEMLMQDLFCHIVYLTAGKDISRLCQIEATRNVILKMCTLLLKKGHKNSPVDHHQAYRAIYMRTRINPPGEHLFTLMY